MKLLLHVWSMVGVGSLAVSTLCAADEPFRDPSQPLEARVQDLISRLTLEEKARLLNHNAPTVERFDIRSDRWNQCLNGVKWDRPTTLFPSCLAMSATWNTELVQEV